MSEQAQDEIIEVKEAVDGSASVDLPDNIPNPQAQDAGDAGDDDGDDRSEPKAADSGDADDDHPDDSDALRAAKRDRRRTKKQLVRQTNVEKELKLQMLERQNQELIQRLSVVERKTHSADLARIDKAIEDSELRINYAKMKLSEAA
jgi:hypothetical protein